MYDTKTGAVRGFLDELGHEPVIMVSAAPSK